MLFFLLALIDEESDKVFFTGLYSKYQKQMWLKAYEVLKDNGYAEDAVQTAFCGIAKNIKTVRSLNEPCIRHYLLISARNAAIDIVKKSSNEISIGTFCGRFDSSGLIDLEQAEERDCIFHVLSQMPQIYRDVLYLLLVSNLSEKEISNVLNLKINTVRQQVSRGKKLFATLYEKEMAENETKSVR